MEIDLAKVDQQASNGPNGSLLYHKDEDGTPTVDEEASTNHLPLWRAFEELLEEGKVKSIGVSNFSVEQLKRLIPQTKHPITVNQCEAHPWLQNNKLVDFCKSQNILFEAYCPLGNNIKLTRDETIVRLAEETSMSPQALVLSWALQRGTCPLTRSSKEDRLRSNIAVKELSQETFDKLNALNQHGKQRQINKHPWMKKIWDDRPES